MKKLTPAQKAARTRRARDLFCDTYGIQTFDVVEMLARGKSTQEVSDMLWISVPSAAAYAANFTRGTYSRFLKDCNF